MATDAATVMDPFHVVRLAGTALDTCRRRVQQGLTGHRDRRGDPLYSARRTLHTGVELLTDRQQARLEALFADQRDESIERFEKDSPHARTLPQPLERATISGALAAYHNTLIKR